ncbi:MAG: CoA transferase [Rhodocyclales bacterium]|nr:CoA transferase [Rhodocyclales bacterium]
MTTAPRGPLAGIRILEIAGIGPGPFAGMLLADMGAEVIVVERPGGAGTLSLGRHAIYNRGKRSICIDLKAPRAAELILRLVADCDALIEGMRPGVMERLGLGPDLCLARQPGLVYGRMTGWGQDGPLAQRAGHDINYIALSGALWYSGQPDQAPLAPPTLVGDLGGGALYLALGILAGILRAKAGGGGQVVDAAIVDGSANLMNLLLAFAAGGMPTERGKGWVDGPYWYGTYRCADGRYLAVGPIEAQFHAEFLGRLGLAGDPVLVQSLDDATWPVARARLAQVFAAAPQDHWCRLFEGSDACVAPVLDPWRAAEHPQLAARKVYQVRDDVFQAAPAPRFSAFADPQPGPVPVPGGDWRSVLASCGIGAEEAAEWLACGVVTA